MEVGYLSAFGSDAFWAFGRHCLPAHREEEITTEIFEQHAQEIFDEAENRLHAQKAVMLTLMRR